MHTLIARMTGTASRSYDVLRIPSLIGILVLGCSIACAQATSGQTSVPPAPAPSAQSFPPELPPVDLKSLPQNLFLDQAHFWSTPFRMKQSQWQWAVPLALVGAGMLASDTAIEQHVPTNPSTVSHAVT
ncbi:MAG: hypothetical protein ACRD4I_15735, partial [Candidatus Angelobacter sp.]